MLLNNKFVKAIKARAAFLGLSDSRLDQCIGYAMMGSVWGGFQGLVYGYYALLMAAYAVGVFFAVAMLYKLYDHFFGGYVVVSVKNSLDEDFWEDLENGRSRAYRSHSYGMRYGIDPTR